jgi:hypothetical protein
MATTTNYGWTTPDDTALVKDGASAIRTLGSSVDTTTKNLNPETTLGDLAYRSSSANVKTRLGIGSTGNVLTVTGGVPVWAAPAGGGGMTVLASGSITNTALSLTSIDQTYIDLYLYLDMEKGGTAAAYGSDYRLNVNTGSVYSQYRDSLYQGGTQFSVDSASTSFRAQNDFFGSGTKFQMALQIHQYANTTSRKIANHICIGIGQTSTPSVTNATNMFDSTAAITSIQTINTALTGSYILYGVK